MVSVQHSKWFSQCTRIQIQRPEVESNKTPGLEQVFRNCLKKFLETVSVIADKDKFSCQTISLFFRLHFLKIHVMHFCEHKNSSQVRFLYYLE